MYEDLTKEMHAERANFVERMQKSIERMGKRIDIGGLKVEYLKDTDEIELLFGHRPDFYITQQNDWMQIHIDPDTDDIIGITLRQVSASTNTSEFARVLRRLTRYGTVHISPENHGAEMMANDIRELVGAH